MTPKYLLLPIFLLITIATIAQRPPIYSKVEMTLDGTHTVQSLNDAGLTIDHVHKHARNTIDFVVNESELRMLQQLQVPHEVIVEDLTADYLERLAIDRSNGVDMSCGLIHFDEGNMGMYHTYDDMVGHINQMQQEFPDIVMVEEAGITVENRTVYYVKISDNVNQDESSSEGVVYYDAVHHAREPVGLETHLYYMWWLLENYGTDPEATYLIDNREIYFIPIVNPDGYVYNQTTDPNGGGFWRKNRKVNQGSCFGVDLNRNYDLAWGNAAGSSSNPCNDTYHGTAPFSELETQNVRNLVAQINPAIAFSCHTYSDVFLSPTDANFNYSNYDMIADFSSEFIPEKYKGYGSTEDMISYIAAGTAGDYINAQGIPAWIPEIGHQFWESPSDICDRVQEVFPAMKYLSWVAGDYTTFHSAYVLNSEQLWHGDPLEIVVKVRNKGLTHDAQNIVVTASSTLSSLTPITVEADLGTIPSRGFKDNATTPFWFYLDGDYAVGEEIPVTITVTQNGTVTSEKTLIFYAGRREVLFSEDCENGLTQWDPAGSSWSSTSMDYHGGSLGITDSPNRNYAYNALTSLTSFQPIDLTLTENPFLEFKAKWSMEEEYDFVTLEASLDQVVWEKLNGKYTGPNEFGEPAYIFNKYWIDERVDLNEFVGAEKLYLRFVLAADGDRQGDGFYFDDLQVVDYSEGTTVGVEEIFSNKQVRLFPNPHNGTTQLSIDTESSASAKLTITDLSGKVIQQRKLALVNGRNQESLAFPQAGVYLVTIEVGNIKEVRKVIGF